MVFVVLPHHSYYRYFYPLTTVVMWLGATKNRTFNAEKPPKKAAFQSYFCRSAGTRTPGLLLPNRNRKLFSDVSDDFSSFPLVFRYSRALFGIPFSACSARVCSNPCGQKTLPDKKRREAFLHLSADLSKEILFHI